MKQLLLMIAGVLVVVSMVVSGFTLKQVHDQQTSLVEDLSRRTALLADSLKESIRPSYLTANTSTIQNVLNKFAGRERLFGLAVYNNKGAIFATSTNLSEDLISDSSLAEHAMDADSAGGDFSTNTTTQNIYVYTTPLHDDEKVIGALVVFQKADYIDDAIWQIWKSNAVRLLVQSLLFSLAVVFILQFIIFRPILNIVEFIRQARTGTMPQGKSIKEHGFFSPITNEITKMSKSLFLARTVASQEAKMRLEKIDSPWTAERLKEFVKAYLNGRQIFVVSNREPYIHKKIKGEVKYVVPASGMVTALESIMEACGGTWMAHGSGDADKETADEHGKLAVPPDDPKYTLKRIWLTEKEIKGHYIGFSNEALWPLCHMAHTRPIFREEDWTEYRKVNGKFAHAILTEIKNIQRPLILVQDYHFALLPAMIKKSRPDAEVGIFWHIPWLNSENFSICPWRKEILEGMLGADVVGFHTQQFCNNFLDTVDKEIESITDLEKFAITHQGHTSYIKPFPISVSFTDSEEVNPNEPRSQLLEDLKISVKYIALGVDRLDYTKGILERLRGVEFLLDLHPEYIKDFVFLQIAPPSRQKVKKYQQFNEDVTNETERINKKFARDGWEPIILIKEHLTHAQIYPLYRAANVCVVTSLSDGMNLVAKEFAAARHDEAGVLVLSEFTGASRDLKGAIIVNPYSAEEVSEAMHTALIMSPAEQHRRMKKMRDSIKNYNIYRWAAELIKAVASVI